MSEIKKHSHLRVLESLIDWSVECDGKSFFVPDIGSNLGAFQFTLEDTQFYRGGHGRPYIGLLKVENEKQFNEFFESLKKLSFYKDWLKENLVLGNNINE